jgi:hypothetical protein
LDVIGLPARFWLIRLDGVEQISEAHRRPVHSTTRPIATFFISRMVSRITANAS